MDVVAPCILPDSPLSTILFPNFMSFDPNSINTQELEARIGELRRYL